MKPASQHGVLLNSLDALDMTSLEIRVRIDAEREKYLRNVRVWIFRLAILVCGALAWQAASGTLIDSFYVSAPSLILRRVWQWLINGTIFRNVLYTLRSASLGFGIGSLVGVFMGLLLGHSGVLKRILDPYIQAINSIPKVALAPLFIMWFGIDLAPKVILAAVLVWFLMFWNVYGSIVDLDQELVGIVRLMGASRGAVFLKIELPWMLSAVFVGCKTALPYSVIGAVVGEMFAATRGVGYLIQYASSQFDTTGVFAALLVLTFVVVLANEGFVYLEQQLQPWRTEGR